MTPAKADWFDRTSLFQLPIALQAVVGCDSHLGLPCEIPRELEGSGEVNRIRHRDAVIEAAVVGIWGEAFDELHAFAPGHAIGVERLLLKVVCFHDKG